MSGSLDRYRTMATEDVAAAYRDLGGLARAIEAQRLQLLAVLEGRQAWRLDGALDAAQWVAATDLVGAAAARDAVDTARALTELPAVAAVAEAGGLSMAQLVPLAVIAEPSTDARWAVEGPGWTPGALVQLARQRRKVTREQAERQRPAVPAAVEGPPRPRDPHRRPVARRRRRDRLERDPPPGRGGSPDGDGVYEPYESRCADALVETCSSSSEEAGHPEVVVHVPVGVEQLAPTLDDGTPVATDVLRGLACDATARLVVENPDGTVAGYGRRKRIVRDKLRNRLRQRDRHCRFPGCHRRRGLKAHHLKHWTEGGETEEDNCFFLCHRHHALVHEGGWTVTGSPCDVTLAFHRPWGGAALPNTPLRARPDLLRRYGLDAA